MTELENHCAIQDPWDCVVIGAGPAGTVVARQAALAGLKTLLVERHSFPRFKVCGACLNRRALQVLQDLDLSASIDDLGGMPVNSLLFRGYGTSFARSLPTGLALSRQRLDTALLNAAIAAGATALMNVDATVGSATEDDQFRTIRLKPADGNQRLPAGPTEVRARAVIAADGIGHPSLKSVNEFSDCMIRKTRIGVGAVLEPLDDPMIDPHRIYMAASRHGYAGMVRIEQGRINLAAAIDPALIRSQGSMHAAFNHVLQSAGFAQLPLDHLDWRGTPALTRQINRVAFHRILVVGDAVGYLEPFTGEGMAWAMAGGQAVVRAVVMLAEDQCQQAADRWRIDWRQQVQRRQSWCRRLAWLLRRPVATRLSVSLATTFPRVADRIVNQLNADFSASP